jgi:hypothetical protein
MLQNRIRPGVVKFPETFSIRGWNCLFSYQGTQVKFFNLSSLLDWTTLHFFSDNTKTNPCRTSETLHDETPPTTHTLTHIWILSCHDYGISETGVELPTDDCRQPEIITDENNFLLFFYGGSPFFWKILFWLKKWRFLHKKWWFSPSTSRLNYLLRLHHLHLVRPCTGSVIVVWLSQSSTFLFLSIMVFLRTRLSWTRTVFSTISWTNLFLCLMCIHPTMFHIWCNSWVCLLVSRVLSTVLVCLLLTCKWEWLYPSLCVSFQFPLTPVVCCNFCESRVPGRLL